MVNSRVEPPRWARWVSRISLVAALIAMVVTIETVGWSTISNHLVMIGPWFVAVLAVEAVSTFCDARAIHEMASEPDDPFGRVLYAQIAGRAVNAVTPLGTLGEATKASSMTRTMPTRRVIASILFCDVVSLVVSLTALAVGGVITAMVLHLPQALEVGLYVTSALAALAAMSLLVLMERGMLTSLVPRGRLKKWRRKFAAIDREVRSSAGDPSRRRATMWVISSKACMWAQMWLILAAAGYSAGPSHLVAIVTGGVLLGWIAALVPLGAGVTESGNFALFTAIGAPPSFGVALALARRINQIVYAALSFALIGVWGMFRRKS